MPESQKRRTLATLITPGFANENECWIWEHETNHGGYGLVRYEGRKVSVHRLAYERLVGPIPEGLQIDHLCRVRACFNPAHLEPVTPAENTRRGMGIAAINASKTHCPQGHSFADYGTVRADGFRRCRLCDLDRDRAYRKRLAKDRADYEGGQK